MRFSELDHLANYILPDAMSFLRTTNVIYPVSAKWALLNFCRFFSALINDFFNEKYNVVNQATYSILHE